MLHYGFAYNSPKACTSTPPPTPGAKALGDYAKARWQLPLVGISNCRTTVFGTPSTHGEGRGDDLHVHLRGIEDPPVGDELTTMLEMAEWLVADAEPLGVQEVIRLDRRWDSITRTWRPYGGLYHGNHVHTALCWPAAYNLTLADIESLEEDMPSPAQEAAAYASFLISMYHGYFGADPDAAGFDYWHDMLVAGTPFEDVRAAFAKAAGV